MSRENASFDDFERVLLILTLLISGSGKCARFRGGASIGTTKVPDGQYVAPGPGGGGLKKENASDDNIEGVLLIPPNKWLRKTCSFLGVNIVIWGP